MAEPTPESRSRYEVITTLGQGGMARVLLTISRGRAGVQKLLVVKELKDDLKGDPEFVTMFLDEARIAARLNHPNVIQTYEVSDDGEHPQIVMEYLEGQSLAGVSGRVKRKNVPLDFSLYVIAQAAAGLHYAHELKSFDGTPLGIVHRDVSPHNVFVTYDGLVKVVDFGIAKAADSAGVTRTGVFKGKVTYAAPEQLESKPVDRRADVFALGVMLWEALAHQRIASGEPEIAVMKRRCEGNDPKIREAAPDAPEELCRIVDKAMALKPDDRYATAQELRLAIEAFLETSRRIGPEQVGSFVREHFAQDREKVRLLVEAHARSQRPPSTPDTADLAQAETKMTPSAQRAAGLTKKEDVALSVPPPSIQSEATLKAAETKALPADAPPSRSRTFLVVGVAVLSAAVVIQLLRGGSSKDAAAGASSAASSASATAEAAATVTVQIAAAPTGARIFLDDVALATNPFKGTMPKSSQARKLRVVADGFTTEERLLTLDRDLTLELSLRPADAATAGATASSAAPAQAGGAPPILVAGKPGVVLPTAAPSVSPLLDKPAAPSSTAPSAPATAAPSTPTPGESLTATGGKKPRNIDVTY
ncbi:MAG: serine/threonine-protein kinase [Polyangiaceae bacterium]